MIVVAGPLLFTQTCPELCKIPTLACHSPALPSIDYCN